MSAVRAKSGKLQAREVPVAALDGAARDTMWRLFERYYLDVSRATFDSDLAAKDYVLLVVDSGDRSIQGFSTLEVYDQEIDGRRVVALFSGDTIVEKEYWGQPTIHRAFWRFILKQKLKNPTTPVFWFLISKGYKTYLLLTRNCVEHWPRHDRATPAWETKIIDALSRQKFGDLWDPLAGVMRMKGRDGRLKQGVAPIDQSAFAEPDIRFFAARNPGYVDGDELACLAQIDLRVLVAFAQKQIVRAIGVGRSRGRAWASRTASF